MPASPFEVVGERLQNLFDSDVVRRVVAPDPTFVSLDTGDGPLTGVNLIRLG